MSTPTTEGSGEEKPTLAERIMSPDGDDGGPDSPAAATDRRGRTAGRLRRHQRAPRSDTAGADTGTTDVSTGSAGATAVGRNDRETLDDTGHPDTSGDDVRNTDDLTTEDDADRRDDGSRGAVRADRDEVDADDRENEVRGAGRDWDDDGETVVQPAAGRRDSRREESDLESTQAMPAYEDDDRSGDGAGLAGGAAAGGAAGVVGGTAASRRRVTRDELYAREDRQGERDRLERARAEHQATAGSDTATDGEPVPATTDRARQQRKVKPPRTTDKFFGSIGLFVLRVITGVVMGIHGVQKLLNMDGTAQFFSQLEFFGTPLPQPGLLAIITGAAEVLIGVSLIFGFLTRLSGLGVLIISLGALLMVKMTSLPTPFAAGSEPGFDGELELILAAVGLLFLLVGGGGWGLDRLFRRKNRTGPLDDEL
ncbi:MAG: DoxX family membrane protein [Propionibacteriales bacterium]|nr:DoxX family membrane protein [Propionibacteriales bacterium]